MYFFPAETAASVLASGMKANISRPVQALYHGDPGALTRTREASELFDAWNGAGNGLVIVDFAIHGEYTCNEETVLLYSSLCKEKKGNMHIHLSETLKEHEDCKARYGKTPARWVCDLGVFDVHTYAAHCVAVEPEDIEILKEKNVSIVHNPTSNLKLGSGFAPVPLLIFHTWILSIFMNRPMLLHRKPPICFVVPVIPIPSFAATASTAPAGRRRCATRC